MAGESLWDARLHPPRGPPQNIQTCKYLKALIELWTITEMLAGFPLGCCVLRVSATSRATDLANWTAIHGNSGIKLQHQNSADSS